jgi:hypothetical protein
MMDWRVGQKVVCIDDDFGIKSDDDPRLNEIFEIDLGVHVEHGVVWLKLCGRQHWFYCSDYFRPAVSPETDISIFADILDRVNRRDKVEV